MLSIILSIVLELDMNVVLSVDGRSSPHSSSSSFGEVGSVVSNSFTSIDFCFSPIAFVIELPGESSSLLADLVFN